MGSASPRLILLVNALLRHGPGLVVSALATAGRQGGMGVTVATLDAPDPALQADLTAAGVVVVHLPTGRLRRDLSRTAWQTVYHQMDSLNGPTVLHTHGLRADVAGRVAGRLRPGTRVISTLHDTPGMYTLALGAGRGTVALGLQLATLPLAHQVVMVSHQTRDAYRALRPWGWLARRAQVIHNGVADCGASPADSSREPLVVGTLARLTYRKGIHRLIEAAQLVGDHEPAPMYRVAGEGELAEALQQQIAAAGLETTFSLVGLQRDPAAFLRQVDIFVLPSLDECLPLAILEAMSAGKAIVATDVGGVAEAIQDDYNGLLVAPDDAAALATAVRRLLASPRLRARLGAAARRSYQERFTLENMTTQYLDLYTQVLA